MDKILILNGPNLNMVGMREPGIYGENSMDDIVRCSIAFALEQGFECDYFQSNCEGEIIDKIHASMDIYKAVILNAGAYTHYSYAIADAIACVNTPFIEIHMSNIFARDDFRHKSVIAPVCKGSICGFGKDSYTLAISAVKGVL